MKTILWAIGHMTVRGLAYGAITASLYIVVVAIALNAGFDGLIPAILLSMFVGGFTGLIAGPVTGLAVGLFTRLFGGGVATNPRTRARLNALDAVRDDARRLQQRLGAADRARLDAHLTAIREVRRILIERTTPSQPQRNESPGEE